VNEHHVLNRRGQGRHAPGYEEGRQQSPGGDACTDGLAHHYPSPYAFDPHIVVGIDDFEDVIGRHFRQPEEGLGFDNSPVAHMWRTMIWPRNSL
jgi:hypothetical protein